MNRRAAIKVPSSDTWKPLMSNGRRTMRHPKIHRRLRNWKPRSKRASAREASET